jgi:hypothetical protein
MSPDRFPDRERELSNDYPNDFPKEHFLRQIFSEANPDLEAKASESMPRDLDALFEKNELCGFKAVLQDRFSRDLQTGSQSGSPAFLDAATASELDRRVAEGTRGKPNVDPSPQTIPMPQVPMHRVGEASPILRAPILTGLAAAALLGMLYLWGEGYVSTNPGDARSPSSPLFVLVDVEKPLDTSMDPSAISLAAAGLIDFVEGSNLPASSDRDDRAKPKKEGEE